MRDESPSALDPRAPTVGIALVRQDDGIVLGADRRAAELLSRPLDSLIGTPYRELGISIRGSAGDATVQRGVGDGAPQKPVDAWLEPIAGTDLACLVLQLLGTPESGDGSRLDELLRAEATYRTLIEQIPAITYTELEAESPFDATAAFISPQIAQVLGQAPGNFPTLAGWSEAIHPADRQGVLDEAERTGVTGEPFIIEYRVLTGDGGIVWIRDHAVRATDPVTGVRQWQGVMLDITAQKQAEEALRRVTAERESLLHRTVRAAEDERARLAAALHDGPVQRLTALMLRLASLRGRTENAAPPADPTVSSELRELEQQVGLEIGLLRSMMVELRPVALDRWGLEAALREQVDELNSGDGPVVRATIEDHQDLPHEVETVFYRIAQEALRNVVRHAHADEVHLELRREHDELVMRVSDDGVGFDLSTVMPNEAQFGLLIMRERAEMLQGRLDVRSVPGKGTTLQVVVPLIPAQMAAAPTEPRSRHE